jgi:hypothetical protein
VTPRADASGGEEAIEAHGDARECEQ